MENMELNLQMLDGITGGTLTEEEKGFLRLFVKSIKDYGCPLERCLKLPKIAAASPECQEFIRSIWDEV